MKISANRLGATYRISQVLEKILVRTKFIRIKSNIVIWMNSEFIFSFRAWYQLEEQKRSPPMEGALLGAEKQLDRLWRTKKQWSIKWNQHLMWQW